MHTPEHTSTATPPPEAPPWSEEDVTAAMQSAFWFDSHISEELIGPYRGMHIAIFGQQIIDSDRDRNELCRRLDAKSKMIPPSRLVLRYIPTEEEAITGQW